MPPWELPERRRGEHYLVVVRAADAGDDATPDPGLSATGRDQAEAMAASLASLGPLTLVVAPCRRARETGAPLAERWGPPARVEPALADPDPKDLDDLGWRRRALQAVAGIEDDAVVIVEEEVLAVLVDAERRGEALPAPGAHVTLRLPAS